MKGIADIAVDTLIHLVITVAVIAVFMALMIPAITSTDQYASCDAVMRPIAAVLYNWAGINIC